MTPSFRYSEITNILARRGKLESVAAYRLSGSTYSRELDEKLDTIQQTEGWEQFY